MIQSIRRAIDVLFVLHDGNPEGMFTMEIARAVGLPKATTYNILKTLKAREVLEQDGNGGRYRLGKKLFTLSFSVLSDNYLAEKLLPSLKKLAGAINEVVSVAALRNAEMKVLCRIVAEQEITLAPNQIKPLYSTACGRCILAQLKDNELAYLYEHLGKPGELWPEADSYENLAREVKQIQSSGFSLLYSEARHVVGIGMILKNGGRYAPLAVGCGMPIFRFAKKKKRIETELKKCAAEMDGILNQLSKG